MAKIIPTVSLGTSLKINGHRLHEHGGAWQGFTAHYARYPDDHLSVIVLTNLESGQSEPGKIAHEVAALYIPALKTDKVAQTLRRGSLRQGRSSFRRTARSWLWLV